jgi:serine/threonine protein phosphatase PrpC
MPTNESVPRWQAFHLAKAGNAPAEYEDAFAASAARSRFAVADGASEASFAAAWARLLAEGFVEAKKPWQNLEWLEPVRQRWSAEVDGLPVPWYAEEKREMGAFATLLGVAFRPPDADGRGAWRALAVGDSCLFWIRQERMLGSFPLTRSDDFGNEPRLLCSRPSADTGGKPDRASGHWRPGDRFLLMTDALAHWFLHEIERGVLAIAEVAGLLGESDPQAAFRDWVETRRATGLRNDDVTLLVIDL